MGFLRSLFSVHHLEVMPAEGVEGSYDCGQVDGIKCEASLVVEDDDNDAQGIVDIGLAAIVCF